ncbi:acyloxyacyl hydrolase [Dyella japonica]|uniref:acyloxyacyl hydrolase n=1 Tax=Dyella japonica TaxID=231455 RepID=UPI0009DB6B91|nr:acyloxyacyl hydrolase [Dyella japonica]
MPSEYHPSLLRLVKPCARGGFALCLLIAANESFASQRIEVQVGRSYMDHAGATTVFVDDVFSEQSIGLSRFNWSPEISAGWIDGRDLQRYKRSNYTTTDAIGLVAAGVHLSYGTRSDWYHSLFFSFQPALHTGKTQALSSVYEFVSSFGWQSDRFSLQLRHISNGSFHQPNRGETMVLFGIRLDSWRH